MKEPLVKKAHLNFVLWFVGIFFLTYTFLYATGLVPSVFQNEDTTSPVQSLVNAVAAESPFIIDSNSKAIEQQVTYEGESPTHITIKKIGVNASISNPTTTDVAGLDAALTKGAVRYPGSGLLADGNVFIFGHSSNWSVVRNQAYKTFDDLDKLSKGDSIEVKGTTRVYVYIVQSVSLADSDKVWVDLSSNKPTLTLSTCNTFGKKQERYVVQAEFNRSYAL